MPPFVHHPHYRAALETGHSFPINKFQRLAEILVAEGLVDPDGFHTPEPASEALLCGVHDPAYVRQVLDFALPRDMQRRIGLPMTEEFVRRARAVCGGTLLAARLALTHGIACNTAGGSHHAGPDFGAGYCIFNDVAIAAKRLLTEGVVRQILVVDLDVHQGDGTALIFADDPRVFTFSMHAQKNFPARKAKSDLDIGLDDGLEDEGYRAVLSETLPALLDSVKPGLVFYVAGVDPHRDDRLGRLALSDEGLAARDSVVLETCLARGTPIAGVLGGGYDRDIDRIANRHATLHRAAHRAAMRGVLALVAHGDEVAGVAEHVDTACDLIAVADAGIVHVELIQEEAAAVGKGDVIAVHRTGRQRMALVARRFGAASAELTAHLFKPADQVEGNAGDFRRQTPRAGQGRILGMSRRRKS